MFGSVFGKAQRKVKLADMSAPDVVVRNIRSFPFRVIFVHFSTPAPFAHLVRLHASTASADFYLVMVGSEQLAQSEAFLAQSA